MQVGLRQGRGVVGPLLPSDSAGRPLGGGTLPASAAAAAAAVLSAFSGRFAGGGSEVLMPEQAAGGLAAAAAHGRTAAAEQQRERPPKRTFEDWRPEPLLCKRLNVSAPRVQMGPFPCPSHRHPFESRRLPPRYVARCRTRISASPLRSLSSRGRGSEARACCCCTRQRRQAPPPRGLLLLPCRCPLRLLCLLSLPVLPNSSSSLARRCHRRRRSLSRAATWPGHCAARLLTPHTLLRPRCLPVR